LPLHLVVSWLLPTEGGPLLILPNASRHAAWARRIGPQPPRRRTGLDGAGVSEQVNKASRGRSVIRRVGQCVQSGEGSMVHNSVSKGVTAVTRERGGRQAGMHLRCGMDVGDSSAHDKTRLTRGSDVLNCMRKRYTGMPRQGFEGTYCTSVRKSASPLFLLCFFSCCTHRPQCTGDARFVFLSDAHGIFHGGLIILPSCAILASTCICAHPSGHWRLP
jgi:hypothetical protein